MTQNYPCIQVNCDVRQRELCCTSKDRITDLWRHTTCAQQARQTGMSIHQTHCRGAKGPEIRLQKNMAHLLPGFIHWPGDGAVTSVYPTHRRRGALQLITLGPGWLIWWENKELPSRPCWLTPTKWQHSTCHSSDWFRGHRFIVLCHGNWRELRSEQWVWTRLFWDACSLIDSCDGCSLCKTELHFSVQWAHLSMSLPSVGA